MAPPQRLMTTDGSRDWVTLYPAIPDIHLIVKTRMFRDTLIATGVGVESDWVDRLCQAWETKVIELLDSLVNGTYVQKAVMSAIKQRCADKKYKVIIYPREYHPRNTPSGGTNEYEVIDQILNSAADGATKGGIGVPAQGESAIVYFDPEPWRSDSFVRQEAFIVDPNRWGGVGMEADQNLLHELVHALRRLRGVTDRTPTKTYAYRNLEEFACVLITNIATNEKNPGTPLRNGERAFVAMPPEYRTSAGYLQNPEHRDLVKKIVDRDPNFARDIANSPYPNPFNPVRRHLRGALWSGQMADW